MVFGLALSCRFCCLCFAEADLDVAVIDGGGVVDGIVFLHEYVAEDPVLHLDIGLFEKGQVTS